MVEALSKCAEFIKNIIINGLGLEDVWTQASLESVVLLICFFGCIVVAQLKLWFTWIDIFNTTWQQYFCLLLSHAVLYRIQFRSGFNIRNRYFWIFFFLGYATSAASIVQCLNQCLESNKYDALYPAFSRVFQQSWKRFSGASVARFCFAIKAFHNKKCEAGYEYTAPRKLVKWRDLCIGGLFVTITWLFFPFIWIFLFITVCYIVFYPVVLFAVKMRLNGVTANDLSAIKYTDVDIVIIRKLMYASRFPQPNVGEIVLADHQQKMSVFLSNTKLPVELMHHVTAFEANEVFSLN